MDSEDSLKEKKEPGRADSLTSRVSIPPNSPPSDTRNSSVVGPIRNRSGYQKDERYSSGAPLQSHATTASDRAPAVANTTLSTIRSRRPVPPFTHPLAREKTAQDVIVEFDGLDDPYHPMNWKVGKKIWTTALYGLTTMGATFLSSVYTPAVQQVTDQFEVGRIVGQLGLALLLFGFGVGPLLWAPISEVYGRKNAVILPYFIATMFVFGSGAAKDIQTLMITRFFAGFFASAPITNTGGVLADIWPAQQRAAAMVGYAMAVIVGPIFGPIVGGAIIISGGSWRWTEFTAAILMMIFLVLDIIFLDESFPPVLLVYKARRLRFETGNWALHARHEEWDVTLKELGNRYLVRPFQMLLTPICFLVALYASFVYGILYGNLAAFPIVFQEIRGWNVLVGSLPFLGLLIGVLLGAVINIVNNTYYTKCLKKNGGRAVPEARLPPMMLGSVLFATGLFLFGWTADPRFHWIVPVVGAAFSGIGFFTIFQACLNYLIDTFTQYGASAVAANTFLRSAVGGAFPLFMGPMLHNMGVNWGISVFGFFAVALIPIPFMFFVFGKRIRARGVWSRASA
ncbi:putative MFS multidrug transporter [Eremomyces bilateralis CBS 781.70]|uniref:MFS multidrug transporter n=1 Tax=Eremomyces bilateralis CBS 781.70 TaxID=1392243 RepID=A0A6G1GAD7_9PEZI|nr:putative MFS multidrug transporter [Eremomyces bilateralis CBS 781.70]KAF1814799.1 putative MFS multidrug transporter [Eremomyces bilateralis CBS 781.70]